MNITTAAAVAGVTTAAILLGTSQDPCEPLAKDEICINPEFYTLKEKNKTNDNIYLYNNHSLNNNNNRNNTMKTTFNNR